MHKNLLNGLMDVKLPKWPQMYTTGKPVTVEQAKEIIRRTDSLFVHFYYGNDKEFVRRVVSRLKVPLILDYGTRKSSEDLEFLYQEQDRFAKGWGTILTEYVINQWLSCNYVEGPYGWCHPDGKIGFIDNVGKWPAVFSVYSDWVRIARAFPFLEIDVSLKGGESCQEDMETVVGFRIRNESVRLAHPDSGLHEGHEPAARGNMRDGMSEADWSPLRRGQERGIPLSWISDWEQHSWVKTYKEREK